MSTDLSLPDFLLARYAEDEASAQAATPGPWRVAAEGSEGSRIAPDCEDKRTRSRFIGILNGRVQPEDGYNATHIARHDPARVLADIEAKRQIVKRCAPLHENVTTEFSDDTAPILADEVLLALALPYVGHPDFREEWRA